MIRKSVDSGKLTTKETDTLAELILRLGIDGQQVDADQADYRYVQSMAGRDLKAESAEAQKVLFAAVEELRVIERETIPALRKTIANARGRNQQAGYERQKLEQIAGAKPWLIPAPAEQSEK
jgi:hypothetical protein